MAAITRLATVKASSIPLASRNQAIYSTAFAILASASSVPSAMCFFTMPVNMPRKPASLMSQTTSIRVLSPEELSVTTLVPFSGPSVIAISTDLLGLSTTVWRHFESLNAIVTSRSIVFPFLLMFFTVLVPCQYCGSLSTSATIAHTLSSGADTSRLALMVAICSVYLQAVYLVLVTYRLLFS